MNLMEKASNHNCAEINGLNQVGQQRSLDADNVPSCEFIRAGHCQEPLALKNAIPRLKSAFVKQNSSCNTEYENI